MTNLSSEHTIIAAIPILIVLAVLSAAIIVFPKINLDDRSRASTVGVQPPTGVEPQPPQSAIAFPTTTEPSITPYQFPQTSN